MICDYNHQFSVLPSANAFQHQYYGYRATQQNREERCMGRNFQCGISYFDQKLLENGYRSMGFCVNDEWNKDRAFCRFESSDDDGNQENTGGKARSEHRVGKSGLFVRCVSENLPTAPSTINPEVFRGIGPRNTQRENEKMFFDRYDVASFHDNSLCDHFDTVSSVSTIGFQDHRLFSPAGGHHLSEMQEQKYQLQPRSCSKPHSGEPVKKKKKRYRPFAAARERDRLVVMNSALRKLKSTLPLEDKEQKLSKKDILQTAVLYIKFLTTVLNSSEPSSSEKDFKSLNLNEHNYLNS